MRAGVEPERGFRDGTYSFLSRLRSAVPDLIREGRDVVQRWTALRFVEPWAIPRSALAAGDWARFPLDLAGVRIETNRRHCPAAAALVDALAARALLGSAAFYLLGPRSWVRPHRGLDAGFLRCHVGLVCPPGCELRVGDERRAWTAGGVLVFDDAVTHEAWNPTDATRCVFHFDFADPARSDADDPSRLRALCDVMLADLVRTRPIVLAADLRATPDLSARLEAARADAQRDLPSRAALDAGAQQLTRSGLFL